LAFIGLTMAQLSFQLFVRQSKHSKVSLAHTEAKEPRARFSFGVPELSLILGSSRTAGVSGRWCAEQPAHER
jgi:hypothetical protein